MGLYVISWKDRPNSLDLRLATREAHLAYGAGRIRLGGPFLDEAGEMVGSLLVIEAESLEEARAFHAADPYVKAGLVGEADISPWRATLGAIA